MLIDTFPILDRQGQTSYAYQQWMFIVNQINFFFIKIVFKDKKSVIEIVGNQTDGEMCAYIHIDQSGERTMRPTDCLTHLKYLCRFGNDWKTKGILVYEWHVFIYKYFYDI